MITFKEKRQRRRFYSFRNRCRSSWNTQKNIFEEVNLFFLVINKGYTICRHLFKMKLTFIANYEELKNPMFCYKKWENIIAFLRFLGTGADMCKYWAKSDQHHKELKKDPAL